MRAEKKEGIAFPRNLTHRPRRMVSDLPSGIGTAAGKIKMRPYGLFEV
jgi:hypothetical protein